MQNLVEKLQAWINGTAIRDRVIALSETKEHRQFVENFVPIAGADYAWFLTQSVKEFELTETRVQEIDSKADTLIGYLGAVEGILAMVMIYIVSVGRAWLLLVSVPTMVAFLVAILLAITARSPALHPVFPSTEEFLSEYPEGHYASFAARVAATSQIAGLAIKEKAKLVRRAYWFLNLGLLWFVIGAFIYSLLKVF